MDDKTLIPYNVAAHEPLLIQWFFTLRKDNDLDRTFYKDLHNLTSFLNFFANSVKLVFAIDVKGIWLAGWVKPILDAAELGLWIREDSRQSLSRLKTVYALYDAVFEKYKVIVGISKQPALRRIHEHMGYTANAEIPEVWSGEPIQIYFLTKDAYNGRRHRFNSR